MVLITLIGEPMAKVGNKFIYLGPLTECKECKLKNVCFNLEPGTQYEVSAVRDHVHDCALREDTVRVVEVSKIPLNAAIQKKQAIEGSMITFQTVKCEKIDCINYARCHPIGSYDGRKYTITEVNGDLECPIGEKMVSTKII